MALAPRLQGSRSLPGLIALTLLGALTLAPSAPAATGDLTQKAGTAGCISDTGTGGACAEGPGGSILDGTNSIAVSSDGKNAYATSANSHAVNVFDRDPSGGALEWIDCNSNFGAERPCTGEARFLRGPRSVTIAPDGESVYAAGTASDAIVLFDRTASGRLLQLAGSAGCFLHLSPNPAVCADGIALDDPVDITVSPSNSQVSVASYESDAIVFFDRDAPNTELDYSLALSVPAFDGATSVTYSPFNNYATGQLSDAVTGFGGVGCISENGSGGCAAGTGLNAPQEAAVSPDGEHLYVVANSSDAVSVIDINGAFTQESCISETGAGLCADGRALNAAYSVAVSPDGKSVYVAARLGDAVAVFDRNGSTGQLTQKPGAAGCISETGADGCADGVALDGPRSLTVSPDGKNVYVASSISDAVAVFDRDDGGRPATPPDTTVEGSASAKKKQKQKGKKVVVKAKVKAGEDLDAKATGKVKLGKRSYKLKPKSKSVSSGNSKNLKLKPKKRKHAKKIAKALKKGKKAKAKLTVKLTDEAGNKKSEKLSVKLKR